jgi:hypothetical protein
VGVFSAHLFTRPSYNYCRVRPTDGFTDALKAFIRQHPDERQAGRDVVAGIGAGKADRVMSDDYERGRWRGFLWGFATGVVLCLADEYLNPWLNPSFNSWLHSLFSS